MYQTGFTHWKDKSLVRLVDTLLITLKVRVMKCLQPSLHPEITSKEQSLYNNTKQSLYNYNTKHSLYNNTKHYNTEDSY